VRCVLTLVGSWESTVFGGRRTETLSVEFEPDNGKTEIKIDCLLDKFGILHAKEQCRDVLGGRRGLDIEFQLSARSAHDFLSALVAIPEVVAIERTRRDEASGKTGR
jgi:hypothetical protein